MKSTLRNKSWNVLSWNIRGINDPLKWPHIRAKIVESDASFICIQETKRTSFDNTFIKGFAPKRFDQFAFVPSDGASGGLLTLWSSKAFAGQVVLQDFCGLVISFTSLQSTDSFILTNIYGPCTGIARDDFVAWLFHLSIDTESLWLLVGDFNFYRSVENRNRDGANLQDTETFNEIISYHGLIELPIKVRSFTWSNMQRDPLLVQLDWFFTSTAWTLKFPNTLVTPLARPTSDHIPCVVSIGTAIPKAGVFRFENHWITMSGFFQTVESIWQIHCPGDSAKSLSSKFKLLRKGLKNWSTSISKINKIIDNCNEVIFMIDELEDQRPLHFSERNFRT